MVVLSIDKLLVHPVLPFLQALIDRLRYSLLHCCSAGKIEAIESKHAEMKIQANMEAEHGEAKVYEMKQALERQKDIQRQEHIKQVSGKPLGSCF